MEIIVLIGFFGVLLCFWGVYKMKYCADKLSKAWGLLILGMIFIFPASILYGIKQDLDKMENEPESSGVTREIKQELKDEVFDRNGEPSPRAENFAPTDKNWISDSDDVYLWNPEPQEGESITRGAAVSFKTAISNSLTEMASSLGISTAKLFKSTKVLFSTDNDKAVFLTNFRVAELITATGITASKFPEQIHGGF